MNSKLIFLLPFCWILGCATPLHTIVQEQIHEGDSSSQVKEVLGEPASFGPSPSVPGGTIWVYEKQGSVCGFAFKEDKVSQMACDSSNYRGTASRILGGFGTALQGAGQGLQNSSKKAPTQTHCTSDYAGGYNCSSY